MISVSRWKYGQPADDRRSAPKHMTLEEEIEARERALRSLVEERIQAAMKAGAFENLPGRGKPLQLEDNPFVPLELRLAYKVLANANVAPDWIELDKNVRTAREALEKAVDAHVAWLRRQREQLAPVLGHGIDAGPGDVDPRSASGYSAGVKRPFSRAAARSKDGLTGTLRSIRARHDRFRAELEERLDQLNRRIDQLNLIVPQLSLQRPRLNVADTLAALDTAARAAFSELFE